MESVILAKNIDVDKITFGDLKTSDSGAKNIYLSYNGKPLYAQTPEMTCVYGLSKWAPDGKIPEKYSMELSFQDANDHNSTGKFLNVLKKMNEKFLDQAMQKGPEWFRKKFTSVDVVDAIYTSLIKYPKDKETGEISTKYPPTFRINIPYKDGSITCPVYDGSKNSINLFEVESKGAKVTAIIKFSGIWIAGGKFGCTCKVEQLRVIHSKTDFKSYAFQNAEDIEDAEEDDIHDNHNDVYPTEVEVAESDEQEHDISTMNTASEPTVTASNSTVSNIKEVTVADSDEDELEKPKVTVKTTTGRKKSTK